MKYQSTRGFVGGSTFEEALFSGYVSDGGLYVPHEIPVFTKEDILGFSSSSYLDVVHKVLRIYISEDEVPSDDLKDIVQEAFATFDSFPDPIPVVSLADNLHITELFHGPTLAFKDLALSVIGKLLKYFLENRKKHVNILVGTSGDTGSAAIESVRGLDYIDIFVLYPKGLCTELQELQMTTVLDDNVHCFRVEGTSDDLDVPIKECFRDGKFVKDYSLLSINSINWARILVQTAHFIYVYSKLSKNAEDIVDFLVPSGALGHLVSGYIVKLMGFPINLVSCVNENDIIYRAVQNGDFSEACKVHHTLASAMDIQIPYNFERLLYFASGFNSGVVKEVMKTFHSKRKVLLQEEIVSQIQQVVSVSKANDREIVKTIRKAWDEYKYRACPHTATALFHYFSTNSSTSRNTAVMATAAPEKFPEAFNLAEVPVKEAQVLIALKSKEKKFDEMKRGMNWTEQLKDAICKAGYQKCN